MKKVFNLIKRKKVLAGFVFLSLLSLLYLISLASAPPPADRTTVLPTPGKLAVVGSYPAPGAQVGLTFPQTAATVTFNQSVNLNQLSVSIKPPIELAYVFSQDHTVLYIGPQTPWKTDQKYTLTVRTAQGEVLLENSFTFIEPSKSEDREFEEVYSEPNI